MRKRYMRYGQLQRSLTAYLPQSRNGAMLITKRTRSVATKPVKPRDIIPVEPMTDKGSTTLLKNKLGQPVNEFIFTKGHLRLFDIRKKINKFVDEL